MYKEVIICKKICYNYKKNYANLRDLNYTLHRTIPTLATHHK